MRSEGFYVNEEFQMTPAGIEPATFRFAAQHLNHCATVTGQRLILIFVISLRIHYAVCACLCLVGGVGW